MSTKNIGYSLIGLGIFGIVFSLIADFLGIGKAGIQAAQLLGIEVGVILATVGLGFINSQQREKIYFADLAKGAYEWLLNLPTIVWIIIGFLIAYVLLFIFPMFLNPEHRIQYFNRFIPDKAPIGLDLNTIVEFIKVWFSNDQGPYQQPGLCGGAALPPPCLR